jgi:hypothetical protein
MCWTSWGNRSQNSVHRRGFGCVAKTPYPCILAESTAVTMFGRNWNLLALYYFTNVIWKDVFLSPNVIVLKCRWHGPLSELFGRPSLSPSPKPSKQIVMNSRHSRLYFGTELMTAAQLGPSQAGWARENLGGPHNSRKMGQLTFHKKIPKIRNFLFLNPSIPFINHMHRYLL